MPAGETVSWHSAATFAAAFVPASGRYEASPAATAAAVSGGDTTAGTVPLSLTIPESGYFGVTVLPGTVTLSSQGTSASYWTGLLQGIALTDDRNYLPGWSVTGQASDLIAGRQTLSASQLGWVPAGTLQGGARLGPPVAPGNPGLSSPAVLAWATPGTGFGSDTLSAMLLLKVQAGAAEDVYVGTLTITFMEALL
jgi:hypothetical protein